ncbi:MAG: hypothetical protein R3277_07245 [Brumimicrobium sp.]|nr:hypothetical protein [Brumimicrobium sp.]
MKLRDKLHIDIEEFFSTGKFDHLKLGKSKEWVINNFPDPDDYEKEDIFNDDIWTYGSVELHFYKKELVLIYSEGITNLNGGDSIDIRKGILGSDRECDLNGIMSYLNQRQIDFCKKTQSVGFYSIDLILESGVKLGFQLEQNDIE